jgi:hypothetical protein
MNKYQRTLVVSALIVLAAVLVFAFLEWSDGYIPNATKIVTFYSEINPQYRNLINEWGFYTRHGVLGLLLGLIAPICLLAIAAFIALGARSSNSN